MLETKPFRREQKGRESSPLGSFAPQVSENGTRVGGGLAAATVTIFSFLFLRWEMLHHYMPVGSPVEGAGGGGGGAFGPEGVTMAAKSPCAGGWGFQNREPCPGRRWKAGRPRELSSVERAAGELR